MRSHPVRTVLLGVSAMGALAGCGLLAGATAPDTAGPAVTAPDTAGPAVTAPDTAEAGDCPPVAAGTGYVAVDYVDFVHAHGTDYVVDLRARPEVTSADVGPVQFRVRCALGTLNDLTHKAPPPARDHDAAYLPPGTRVHAVNGWSPRCRLTARHDGRWHVYLAQRTDTEVATAKDCALHRDHP